MVFLTGKHPEGGLLLTEGIVDTTPVGIGMIAALMIEGVPLTTANKLTSGVVEFVGGLSQTLCLYQLRTLAPRTTGAVQVVVGIPVIDIFAKLTGEDTLGGLVGLEIVAWPTIYTS